MTVHQQYCHCDGSGTGAVRAGPRQPPPRLTRTNSAAMSRQNAIVLWVASGVIISVSANVVRAPRSLVDNIGQTEYCQLDF